MTKDVLTAINERRPYFSKGQRKLAEYITGNFDKTAFMTAGKLGMAVGVSESTVVRFAADLGYDGYPAMRKALQELIKNRLTSVQRIEASKEMIAEDNILGSVLESDIERLRHTLEEVSKTEFDQAVNALISAKNVYLIGLRSSSSLAGFMGFYLNLLVDNVHVVNQSCAGDIYEQILHISENDVCVAISFPRYSKTTIRAIHYARDCGACIIGITDSESSHVAKISDIRLYAKSDMVSFVDSLVAPLSLINALLVAVAQKSGRDLEDKFKLLEQLWTESEVYDKGDD